LDVRKAKIEGFVARRWHAGYRLHDAEIGCSCFRQLTASLTQFLDGRKSRTPSAKALAPEIDFRVGDAEEPADGPSCQYEWRSLPKEGWLVSPSDHCFCAPQQILPPMAEMGH
jgi:hypothetical protein